MKHLDLFSGIGGFALAAQKVGWRTVGFVEIDPRCHAVLRRHWPDVPIYDDIRTFAGLPADIITGGYPCQPFSSAARGRNVAPDLWPEMLRVVRNVRPSWVVAENVTGRRLQHVERSAIDLEREGYTPLVFDLAAPSRRHIRARAFVVAYADSDGEPRCPVHEEMARIRATTGRGRHQSEPVGVDARLPGRMDRLHMLGNAIETWPAELIFRGIQEVTSSVGDESPA